MRLFQDKNGRFRSSNDTLRQATSYWLLALLGNERFAGSSRAGAPAPLCTRKDARAYIGKTS